MWKNLLVAYDGSEFANKALVNACDILQASQATVSALAVIKLPEPMLGLKPEVFVDDATKYYLQHFKDGLKKCPSIAQKINLDVVVGKPAESLINYAMQRKIDLIIIGFAKKRSILDKFMLGSVSKQVVDHANCSVLLVR